MIFIEGFDLWNNISLNDAINIQNSLKNNIVIKNNNDNFKTIAGVDLSYYKNNNIEIGFCSIFVLDYNTKEVIENKYTIGKVNIPYIAGCLAFRELPLIIKTVKKLECIPDLYIFDGNGYLHPRNMGIATHASFYLKKPTIGVAKSYYKFFEFDFKNIENKFGAYKDIIYNNIIYGRVLKTQKDVKPIFVSIGNYIDLERCTSIVLDFITIESHIPLPIRLADIQTHKLRKEYILNNKGEI